MSPWNVLRFATWNMGCGPRQSRYRRDHIDAWTFLLHELRPDIAFVQEALLDHLTARRDECSVVICDPGEGATAATAVIARGMELSAAPPITVSAESYAATATLTTSAGPVLLVSVHMYPGEHLHADLARLVDTLRELANTNTVIVGGDFNSARRFDEVYGGKKHRTFFEAMASCGLHDVHWGIHGREVQSFWGHQVRPPSYQDDHFFVSQSWAPRVRGCRVINDDAIRHHSDHGPVVAEFDVAV